MAAYGETRPAIPTADGVRMPENRRVKVKVDAEAWSDVVRGVESPDKAYMGGRIAADHLPDVMLFSAAFDFGKLAASLAGKPAPVAAAEAPAAEAPEPNKEELAADAEIAKLKAELKALRGENPLPPADYGTTQV